MNLWVPVYVPVVTVLCMVFAMTCSAECSAAEMSSGEEIFGWVRDLCRHPHRRPGTGFGHEAEQYILDKFTSFGLSECRLEPIDLTVWTPDGWELTVDTDGATAPIPCFYIPYTGFTSSTGVEAELVYIGEGKSKQNARHDVRGKIVLADMRFGEVPFGPLRGAAHLVYDPERTIPQTGNKLAPWFRPNWDATYGFAQTEGAAGFVGILADMYDNTNAYYAPYDGVMKEVPGLYLGKDDGARLRNMLDDAASPVRARLTLTGTKKRGTTNNVVGTIPGKTDGVIIIGSHHDAPFVGGTEDASGVAVVLALARYFSRLAPKSLEKTLVFVASAGHFFGSIGTDTFIETHRDDIVKRTVAEVHVEHVARESEVRDGEIVPTGRAELAVIFVSDHPTLLEYTKDAVVNGELDRSLVLPGKGILGDRPPTDASAYFVEGIPTVSYISGPIYLLDENDTLDKVAVENLEPVASALADIIVRVDATSGDAIRRGKE
jgi:hypothetical protein